MFHSSPHAFGHIFYTYIMPCYCMDITLGRVCILDISNQTLVTSGGWCSIPHMFASWTMQSKWKATTCCFRKNQEGMVLWGIWTSKTGDCKNMENTSPSGWCFQTWILFFFPSCWECPHPNWLYHIFQRGRSTTNQPLFWCSLLCWWPPVTEGRLTMMASAKCIRCAGNEGNVGDTFVC